MKTLRQAKRYSGKDNKAYLILLLFLLSAFLMFMPAPANADTDHNPQKPENVVATVNGKRITIADFRRELARKGGHLPGRFDSIQQRETLVDELIRFEVLAAKAKKAGYEKDPEIVKTVKKMMIQKFWRDQLESKSEDIKVTDQEIGEYYDRHLDEYTGPEMARAAVIYLKFPPKATEEDIEATLKKAEDIIREAKRQKNSDPSFGLHAKDHSADKSTSYRGGDIGWVCRGARIYKWNESVIEAIFSLKEMGDIGPAIQTLKGIYLVKLMDKKWAVSKSLPQVRREIHRALSIEKRRKAQEKYYQSIKNEYETTINKDLLQSIELTGKKSGNKAKPPAFPLD